MTQKGFPPSSNKKIAQILNTVWEQRPTHLLSANSPCLMEAPVPDPDHSSSLLQLHNCRSSSRSAYRPVYPRALCSTNLHKCFLSVKGCLRMIAHPEQVSLAGNDFHCVGGLAHLFWAYVLPLTASLLSSMEETSHRLLAQQGYPTSACLLSRKGTWGIGEALLMMPCCEGLHDQHFKKMRG